MLENNNNPLKIWQPTCNLRFVNMIVNDFSGQLVGGQCLKKNVKILQQMWTSNLGDIEWKEIPIEND